jgi:large subunit ribosomal protein L25
MSGQNIVLDVEERTAVRKGLQALRADGLIPAVVHNHGKESTHIKVDQSRLQKVFQEAGKSHPIQLVIDGKKHLTLIKDVDFEPVKHRMRHVVFQAIRQNEKVHAEVPITFKGEAPAERKSLMVLKQLNVVEIDALPKNLVDSLLVDISGLADVGDRLTVADIQVPEGVEIVTEPEQQIAIVEMPRDQVAEADAAAEGLATDAGVSHDEVPATEQEESPESAPEEKQTKES